ncbi:hypothetical protein [Lapillicoccus jejuensis]|uniref:hypothetical protein n=1 Tax=Lapillicoccus jejuensis TaxID=402171 RepID=UPI001151820F|nr:hypothetical protein [Lapillicoccus jejuensis]
MTREQAHRLRDDRRARVLMAAGAGVLVVVVLVGTLVIGHAQHPDRPVRWPLVIGLAAAVLVVLAAGLLLGLWLRGRHGPTRRYLLSGDRRTRTRVTKQLRKGRPVDENDLEVARAVVDLTERQRWVSLYFLGMAVLYTVIVVLDDQSRTPPPGLLRVLHLALPPFMLFTAVVLFVSRRRLLTNAARQGIIPGSADAGSRRP